jgi:putative membrane protein
MELLQIFPHLNALLNATSGVFLVCGLFFILKKRVHEHRFCMLSASIVSAAFLVSYLSHHALRTYYFGLGPTKFTGEGLARPIYFTILTSHTILAAIVGPFVIATLYRGLKGRFDAHRRLARLVYPVWLYVSATGVIVYLMLYQIYYTPR